MNKEQQAQEAAALERLKGRLLKDKERAQAVKNQHAIWDRLLELRILMQKGLTASYQLPNPQPGQTHSTGNSLAQVVPINHKPWYSAWPVSLCDVHNPKAPIPRQAAVHWSKPEIDFLWASVSRMWNHDAICAQLIVLSDSQRSCFLQDTDKYNELL